MQYGVNYQARGDFDLTYLTDAEIDEDLARFASQGIRHITVIAFWRSFEPTEGNYSTSYLNRLIHFIDRATAQGFLVSMDTHCHMTGNGAPDWVANYGNGRHDMTNVFDPTVRQHWLYLHEWLGQHLGNRLHSLQAWNEPYLEGTADDPQAFVDLFAETKQRWRVYSQSLFTIRTAIYGLHQFWDYPSFYDTCDYVSINFYPGRYGGHTYDRLYTAVDKLHAYGKTYVIGEFGMDDTDDQTQYNELQQVLTTFATNMAERQQPTRMVAWIWLRATQPDYMVWSLCDVDGNPRPAFQLLVSAYGGATLPFHEDFSTLDRWAIQSGSWSVT